MMGNDNFASTTDRGGDYYYIKQPITWTNQEGLITADKVTQYLEGNLTEVCYDGGSSETTCNVTVGSGGRVNNVELEFTVSDNAAYGNPQISNPIVFCANESTAGDFDWVKPLVSGDITSATPVSAPQDQSDRNVIGGECYRLGHAALADQAGVADRMRFFYEIQASSGVNPGVTTIVTIVLRDYTYYLDDLQMWRIGFEDSSILSADADIGADDEASNSIDINME